MFPQLGLSVLPDLLGDVLTDQLDPLAVVPEPDSPVTRPGQDVVPLLGQAEARHELRVAQAEVENVVGVGKVGHSDLLVPVSREHQVAPV